MSKKPKLEGLKLFFVKYSPFMSKKLSIWYLKKNGYIIKKDGKII